jgi:putative flippase GtrA
MTESCRVPVGLLYARERAPFRKPATDLQATEIVVRHGAAMSTLVDSPRATSPPASPREPAPVAPLLDLVLPVYNEVATLERSVARLRQHATRLPFTWRITVADNASTDGTWQVATSLAALHGDVRALHLDAKGRGRALKEAWLTTDAAVCVYMDIDLSTDLDALLPLVAPLVSGHSDVVVGSRLAHGARVARGPKREVISRCYNLLLRTVFATSCRDAQCGFKAVRRDVAERLLPHVRDTGWFFDTELLLLAEHNGLRVLEVPVDWTDDPDSRVRIVSTAVDDLKGVWRMARSFAGGRGDIDLGSLRRSRPVDDFGRRIVSFATVGAVSTLVSLMLYLVFRQRMDAGLANALAVGATALGNTWANRRYTFGVRGPRHRGRHYAAGIAAFVAGLALSSGAVQAAAASGAGRAVELVTLVVAWAAATALRYGVLQAATRPPRPRTATMAPGASGEEVGR